MQTDREDNDDEDAEEAWTKSREAMDVIQRALNLELQVHEYVPRVLP